MSSAPSETLTKLDACAGSLARVYAKEGEFAFIIRTTADGSFRIIGPQTDITRLSEFLRMIADRLFDGPGTPSVTH